MARRKSGKFATVLVLSVLAFAAYGIYTFSQKKGVQDTAHKVEKAAKAAHKAW